MGSALYSYVKTGKLKLRVARSQRGIGNSRVTANMEVPRLMMRFKFMTLSVCGWYRLLREEGLFVGGSQGINVAAAVALAKQLGPGHTIILCDSGTRYQSQLFNQEWLAARDSCQIRECALPRQQFSV